MIGAGQVPRPRAAIGCAEGGQGPVLRKMASVTGALEEVWSSFLSPKGQASKGKSGRTQLQGEVMACHGRRLP